MTRYRIDRKNTLGGFSYLVQRKGFLRWKTIYEDRNPNEALMFYFACIKGGRE